jgi:hypothetical protein
MEYGRPLGEPRHPMIESGEPWPPLRLFRGANRRPRTTEAITSNADEPRPSRQQRTYTMALEPSSYENAGNTGLTMSQQKTNGLLSLGRWTAEA